MGSPRSEQEINPYVDGLKINPYVDGLKINPYVEGFILRGSFTCILRIISWYSYLEEKERINSSGYIIGCSCPSSL